MGHIYCLYGTDEFRPRYVGQSRQDGRRVAQHYGCAADGDQKPVYRWMRSVLLRGHEVHPYILEDDIPLPILDREEALWMSRYPELTNRNRYDRGSARRSYEAAATRRIRKSARPVTYNHGGRIGIGYDRQQDAFFVRIAFGRVDGRCWSAYVSRDVLDGEALCGDGLSEAPYGDGLSSNGRASDTLAGSPCGDKLADAPDNGLWFPDAGRALAARDAMRRLLESDPMFRAYCGDDWRWPTDLGVDI